MNSRSSDLLRLYRTLLKGAARFPLKSRRDVVTAEVQAAFRNPANESLTDEEREYRINLAWERARAIDKYAENMHWFHSRDEVTKEMLHFSEQRDLERKSEMERCNAVAQATLKTDEVKEFKHSLYHYHPDYFNKMDKHPLVHPQDVWKSKGNYTSDTGGPRQKFYVKRYKASFPQGW